MGDVLEIKTKKSPLFNPELKQKLQDGVKEHTTKPDDVVNKFEEILCGHLVLLARELGERFAKWIEKKFSSL